MRWLIQGGALMLPLLICSILMTAIIMERLWLFAKLMKMPLVEYLEPAAVMKRLRQRLVTLHTIIGISPMLGLLGTVTGLMRCFDVLGKLESISDPAKMSLGISEALITTAAGLVIAIVATVFYNHLTARLNLYVFDYNMALNNGELADETTT